MTSRSLSASQMGPTYHRRGSLQLWQFLLALLNDPANQAAIVWTGRGMEFKLIEPEEVRKFNFFPFKKIYGFFCKRSTFQKSQKKSTVNERRYKSCLGWSISHIPAQEMTCGKFFRGKVLLAN